MVFRNTSSQLAIRTSNNAIKFAMDVTDIRVTGKGAIPSDAGLNGLHSPSGNSSPDSPLSLVRAVASRDASGDAKPLIAFRVETKPLMSEVDTVLNVEMQSLQVTFDINTVEAAIAFVKPLEVRRPLCSEAFSFIIINLLPLT